MSTVRQLLERKGYVVWSVPPDSTVFEALEVMALKDVGALLVMEGENLVGIMSERDYARKVILRGKFSKETSVREIMTSSVVSVEPGTSVEQCMALMTEHRIRHLPVIEDERVIGVISIGDVVKDIIEEQGFQIAQLENYITRRR